METALFVTLAVMCFGIGGVAGWLVGKARAESQASQAEGKLFQAECKVAELSSALEHERSLQAEKMAFVRNTFSAVAADALRQNNDGFLALAEERLKRQQEGAVTQLVQREQAIEALVGPVRELLGRFEGHVHELEKVRVGAYEGLKSQVVSLIESQKELRSETANLVHALKSPRIRGRWGEIQLRRVIELAGMLDRCDFFEQCSVATEGGRLRPDVIIRLPGGSTIVVDAKSPLDKYLLAMEAADDETRQSHLAAYAAQVRGHMTALSGKAYWSQFKPAPEFVFMFLPGESFYSAALSGDPLLIEAGANQRVILATPTTLIALLKAVAYGWRQERLAEDSEKISDLGKELYDRISRLSELFGGVGASLRAAVDKYNEAVGTLESRVLVSARRFKELPVTATDKEIKTMVQVDVIPRQLQSPEMNQAADPQDDDAVPVFKLQAGK